MRTIKGLICLFLCLYMLSFARVVTNYHPRTQVGSNDIILTIPKPPATGLLVHFSVWWLLIPFSCGIYWIWTDSRKLMKLTHWLKQWISDEGNKEIKPEETLDIDENYFGEKE